MNTEHFDFILNLVNTVCVNLECDGTSKLIFAYLKENDIDCVYKIGSYESQLGSIPHHHWVECDGIVIDFKKKMWIGEDAEEGFIDNHCGYRSSHSITRSVMSFDFLMEIFTL